MYKTKGPKIRFTTWRTTRLSSRDSDAVTRGRLQGHDPDRPWLRICGRAHSHAAVRARGYVDPYVISPKWQVVSGPPLGVRVGGPGTDGFCPRAGGRRGGRARCRR